MKSKTIGIAGMTCPHCAARVEKSLNGIAGVQARVDTAAKSASVDCPSTVDDVMLIRAIQNAGYKVTSIK